MEDTLNDKLYKAINTYSPDDWMNSIIAKECELICIQSQIDLLTEISIGIKGASVNKLGIAKLIISNQLQSLTNKLKAL